MKGLFVILIPIIMIAIIAACVQQSSDQMAYRQQEQGTRQLVQNQPVPNLGGWSFERQVVIDAYRQRNGTVATWTYTFVGETGEMLEICASIGYPIPYATQITNPNYSEPNGLYSPASAEASWVNCVNADGSVSPTYWEPRVVAFPYRIKAAHQLERADNNPPSFQIDLTGKR